MPQESRKEHVMEKAIAQVAREAADLIRRTAWIQGGTARWDGDILLGVCIGGALNAALSSEGKPAWACDHPAWERPLLTLLREQYPDFPWMHQYRPSWDAAEWNDAEERTKDEVLAILEKLAAQE
jgi:hypothetical protein